MPMKRLGRLEQDPIDMSKRRMKTLPWAEPAKEALEALRAEQPSDEEFRRAQRYEIDPVDFLRNPHLRVRTLETELGHMFRNFLQTLEQELDGETAKKVAYAAGLAHGKRRLGTIIESRGLPGGTETMAMWQDMGHSSAGIRHTTALFARYDDELVEVVRTEDSFGAHTGDESALMIAYFDGFMDGYAFADPKFAYAEEFTRTGAGGQTEFVHRFWYPRQGAD